MRRPVLKFGIFLMILAFSQACPAAFAQSDSAAADPVKKTEAGATVNVAVPVVVSADKVTIDDLKVMAQQALPVNSGSDQAGFDPLKFTLGPEDVVEITVMRHPEFSGTYPIDREGKLQYKFVGDLFVTGMTKVQLEDKVREIISKFVISPEVNVTITEYKSKVFYVLGEVGQPGKYYMRSETITVRDAVVMAGLPTQAAAMRKARIITPNKEGGKTQDVDVYGLLYGGDLKKNRVMNPGDFLYVPSTVMAKVFRVISPVSSAMGAAVSPATSASSGKASANDLSQ